MNETSLNVLCPSVPASSLNGHKLDYNATEKGSIVLIIQTSHVSCMKGLGGGVLHNPYVVHLSLQWRKDPFQHGRLPRKHRSLRIEADQHWMVKVVHL